MNSDAVFTGKVISVRPAEEGRFPDGYYYRLSVLRLFRGPHDSIIEVYTGNDSGGYPLDLDKKYLIFASVSEGKLEIINCDDSTPLSDATTMLHEIQKITIPKDGIVEGQVALNQMPSDQGLPGVQILIHGGGKTYTVTTDDKGWFRVHVPSGVYSAEAKLAGYSVIDYDLSYDTPQNFTVKTGRCAGLQFVADPSYK